MKLFLLLGVALVAAHLCHVGILWEGDTLPLAAAQQMLHGKVLYRDIWFDKPPLVPAFHLLAGARPGWPLRLLGALYALLVCWVVYGFARDLWTVREGRWAAGLMGFFLIFDFPAAVLPKASDLLMVAPHIAAIWMAWKGQPLWSGMLAGLAFWISPKGLFVAAVCALWNPAGAPLVVAGFMSAAAIGSVVLFSWGALGTYWEQVWQWGGMYAARPFLEHPWQNGLVRTLNWLGFHAALVVAAFRSRMLRWPWTIWLALSLLGLAAGLRFFPRYYFLVLPVLVLLAAGEFPQPGKRRWLAAAFLLVPLVRFTPSYVEALRDSEWRDSAMDRDSRAAAQIVRQMAKPGDTLFVWGYRPELFVYAGLPAATIYLDSQPLTGVPADRHLTQSVPLETKAPERRRAALARSRPTFLLDGLGLYNPNLSVTSFPDLQEWLSHYDEAGRSGETVIYRLARP